MSFALYDAREGSRSKISEDFHYDPNSNEMRSIIVRSPVESNGVDGSATPETQLKSVNKMLLLYPSQVYFPSEFDYVL